MDKQKGLSFNVKAIQKNENGEYTGLVLDNGFVLQYHDENGNPIPFNKETIDEILNKTTEGGGQ